MFDHFCLDLVGLVLSEFVWSVSFGISQTENKVWCGLAWFGLVLFGLVWFGSIMFSAVWSSLVKSTLFCLV